MIFIRSALEYSLFAVLALAPLILFAQNAIPDSLWNAYLTGVGEARHPEQSKIDRDLIPILPTTPGLQWNSDGQVLMATWTTAAFFPDSTYAPGYSFTLYGDTWFTAVPMLGDDCKEYDKATLDMRIKQVLGLPPNANKDAFLQVWINPIYLFRPCPDPEISDYECQASIPLVEFQPSPGPGQAPWFCPGGPIRDARPGPAQVSGAYVTVSQDHLNWMCANWTSTYIKPEREQYPWTALGYTFDWGDLDDPVGQSEFVAPATAPVVFDSVTPTAAYCQE